MRIVNDEVDIKKIIELDLISSDNIDIEYPNLWEIYIKEELSDEDICNIVEQMDFKVCKRNELYHLKDLQDCNFGGVEDDKFKDLNSLLKRLDECMYNYGIAIIDYNTFDKIKKQ